MSEETQYRTIGKYQILGTLGRGAMGVVYKARDPAIGHVVAVKTLRKVMPAELQEGGVALERFTVEARAAGNLRHPNLITIFDFSIDGEVPFIVMDFVEGRTLSSCISEAGRLGGDRTIHFLSQIASGLDYAHSRGVLHRDIKPSNIIVDKHDHVYLLDFGVASINQSFSATGDKKQEDLVMGTPGYMPPEQILNKKLDHRSDLFALAVVAFECLAGRRPFPGDTFTVVVERILSQGPTRISEILPGASLELEAIFDRAFARDKEERFNSARELVEALKRALGVSGESARVSSGTTGAPKQFSSWKSVGSPAARVAQSGERGDITDKTSVSVKDHLSYKATPPKPKEERSKLGTAKHEEALFSGAETELKGGDLGKRAKDNTLFKLATIGLGLLCLGLAGVIVLTLLESKPQQTLEVEEASEPMQYQVQAELPDKPMVEFSDQEVLSALRDPTADQVLLSKALIELRERGVQGSFETLARLLGHESYLIRREAILALGRLKDPRAVPEILPLLNDLDPLVRRSAAQAMGELGDEKSERYLKSRLDVEEDPETRRQLDQALSKLASK